MTLTIKIPTQLRSVTNGEAEWAAQDVSTVAEALKQLCEAHQGLKERIFDDTGELRRFVNVYVEGEDIRFMDGLDTLVEEKTTVTILPAVAGGS